MSNYINNFMAYRILRLLVTPFDESDAFKLGIIDKNGTPLKKASELKTEEEKESYSFLHRLVFNLKRLLNKLPGGDKYTKNLIAAYYLIKESYHSENVDNLESRLTTLVECMESNNIILVEEEMVVYRFLEDAGVPVSLGNTSGVVGSSSTETDLPNNNTANVAIYSAPIIKKILRRKKIKMID